MGRVLLSPTIRLLLLLNGYGMKKRNARSYKLFGDSGTTYIKYGFWLNTLARLRDGIHTSKKKYIGR